MVWTKSSATVTVTSHLLTVSVQSFAPLPDLSQCYLPMANKTRPSDVFLVVCGLPITHVLNMGSYILSKNRLQEPQHETIFFHGVLFWSGKIIKAVFYISLILRSPIRKSAAFRASLSS